jgi:hypothetical protein
VDNLGECIIYLWIEEIRNSLSNLENHHALPQEDVASPPTHCSPAEVIVR